MKGNLYQPMGKMYVLGVLFLLSISFNSWAQSKSQKPARIGYVFRADFRDRPTDELVKAHLDSLGYQVTFIDASEPATAASGYDLLIISSTVSSVKLGGKYANITIPVMMWENDIQDDMRYTGRYKGVDFGETEKEHYIWMVNAPHPLSAGIPAGIAVAYNKDQHVGWGKPGLGASIIATLPGQPEKAVIYGYEKGATMDYDFLAPARRTMCLLDNTSFPFLTATGLALFDAAVKWTIEKK